MTLNLGTQTASLITAINSSSMQVLGHAGHVTRGALFEPHPPNHPKIPFWMNSPCSGQPESEIYWKTSRPVMAFTRKSLRRRYSGAWAGSIDWHITCNFSSSSVYISNVHQLRKCVDKNILIPKQLCYLFLSGNHRFYQLLESYC